MCETGSPRLMPIDEHITGFSGYVGVIGARDFGGQPVDRAEDRLPRSDFEATDNGRAAPSGGPLP
jgi:hypothetical protein